MLLGWEGTGQRECKRTEGKWRRRRRRNARPEHIPEQSAAESLKYASTYQSEGYSAGPTLPRRNIYENAIEEEGGGEASYFLISRG